MATSIEFNIPTDNFEGRLSNIFWIVIIKVCRKTATVEIIIMLILIFLCVIILIIFKKTLTIIPKNNHYKKSPNIYY